MPERILTDETGVAASVHAVVKPTTTINKGKAVDFIICVLRIAVRLAFDGKTDATSRTESVVSSSPHRPRADDECIIDQTGLEILEKI
jgi:hypothetical protein